MKAVAHQLGNLRAVEVISNDLLIADVDHTLDWLSTLSYEQKCRNIILHRRNIVEDFFDLKSGLLGEVLRKMTIYDFRLAVVGDFSDVRSKSLAAFISESNRKRQFVFVSSVEEVVEKLWQ